MNDPTTRRLELFKASLSEWLIRNELDTDSGFYSPIEWQSRGEEFLLGAEMILVTEGGLHFLLNYCDAPKLDEFFDLCESFGYWFEMGHSWSLGFYSEKDRYPESSNVTYSEKLRDTRWQLKADAVKRLAGFRCQDCGSRKLLQAHHCWYRYGLEPWQYPLDAFRCLCAACHKRRPEMEHRVRTLMARLSTEELMAVREGLDRLLRVSDRDHAIESLRAIGREHESSPNGML